MAKLGFMPEETDRLDLDLVEAFIQMQEAEYGIEWKMRVEALSKLFGGK